MCGTDCGCVSPFIISSFNVLGLFFVSESSCFKLLFDGSIARSHLLRVLLLVVSLSKAPFLALFSPFFLIGLA